MLCFLPGLVVMFLTVFTFHFIIDKGLEAIPAIQASFKLVTSNFATVLGFVVVGFLLYVAGFIACCIGVIVAFPVVAIATAYTYRSLSGETVAP
jgi:uncharacterized membrane protein